MRARVSPSIGEGADGGAAGAVEHAQQRALGGDGGGGRRVVERRDELGGAGVVGADFDADGALRGGGRKRRGVEIGGDLVLPGRGG